MNWIRNIFSTGTLRSAVIVTLIVVLVVVLVFASKYLLGITAVGVGRNEVTLPLLAIGGVVVLILILTIVAAIFWFLDLTDRNQAMGLPEGSIRAVIALSLIVLFAILAVYLYEGISTGGQTNTLANLSDADRVQFIKDHPTAKDLQAVLVTDKGGQPLKSPDGTPKNLYTVTYRSANPTGDDFAKQLLVLLGTLMTAITSFYLGAGTAVSAAAQTTDLVKPKPTITGVDPITWSISKDGPVIHLKVLGNNLNVITQAKIVRAGVQVIAAGVASSPTRVTGDIGVSEVATPPGGPWDVVVDDGASQSATLLSSLTVVA